MKGIPIRKEKVPLGDAEGRVCAASITPYPPGSPIVCPGEEITREIIDYLKNLIDEGLKIIGIDHNQNILVGEE
jgi:lysine decarboxylase